MLDDLRIDLTYHARDRFRERVGPAADAAIRAAVRRSRPLNHEEYCRYCRGRQGAAINFRSVGPDGTVYCLRWCCPDRVLLLTVLTPRMARGECA